MDAQYENLSAEQKRRLQNIVSIIMYTVDDPEKFIKKVSTDTVLRLMQTMSRDETVVDKLVEMEEHDNFIIADTVEKLARAIDKMGW